ncbi:MAG: hypothetical protein IJ234_05090 [Clostridia bacterium]|nr:hypothetical protein [Clostridia bacterium]
MSSKFIKTNEKIAENVAGGFNKMSESVVSGFNKMTQSVVKGYTAVEDQFVGQFLTKEGETVEDAKKRLSQAAQKDGESDQSQE